MKRRQFLHKALHSALVGSALATAGVTPSVGATSVDSLPPLKGKLTLYLGRGEGGLYENVLQAIQARNPDLELGIRRGPTAALANAIVAESKAGVRRADVFWAVDTGAVGLVSERGLARPLPAALTHQLKPQFRYPNFCPVSGRIRTLPFFTEAVTAGRIPQSIMALPDAGLSVGWAPSYAAFQSFVTAMRVLEGDTATERWLKAMKPVATPFAGELGVVLAVERGEVDVGFANHYYTLRLKAGKPDASVSLAFTREDAGCLVNASSVVALSDGALPVDFMRYLLTTEVQSYLADEAYEIPLIDGVAPPEGVPALDAIAPPRIDLTRLADLRPTLDLLRRTQVL